MAEVSRGRLVDGIVCHRPHKKPWTWRVHSHVFTWDTSTEQHLIANEGDPIRRVDCGYARSLVVAVRLSKDFALEVLDEDDSPPADSTEGKVS